MLATKRAGFPGALHGMTDDVVGCSEAVIAPSEALRAPVPVGGHRGSRLVGSTGVSSGHHFGYREYFHGLAYCWMGSFRRVSGFGSRDVLPAGLLGRCME